MTNDPDPNAPIDDPVEESEGSLTAITDAIGDLATGIPAPVRKNFWKAFGQLCTAATDIYVAKFEGVAAEKRAETRARVSLIEVGAKQIAKEMKVNPEYIRLAANKFTHQVVRERLNLDKTVEVALIELQKNQASATPQSEEPASAPVADIDDDWLNTFEREASQKSSAEMQLLFGKILAGEIRAPSTFSIKTLKLMSQVDLRAATLFRRLCSLCVSLSTRGFDPNVTFDTRVLSLGGNAGTNALAPYGLNFSSLNVLHEHGLIISDYHSYMDYGSVVEHDGDIHVTMMYQQKTNALFPKVQPTARQELRLHGVSLSLSGRELLGIVDIELDPIYTAALHAFFDAKGFTMKPIDL